MPRCPLAPLHAAAAQLQQPQCGRRVRALANQGHRADTRRPCFAPAALQSPPEVYAAYDPASPSGTAPIQPGQTAILKNLATGQFCRLAATPTPPEIGMICDQPSIATATSMTYTGSGLSYNGTPLEAAGPGEPLLLQNTTTGTADPFTLFPPGPLGEPR